MKELLDVFQLSKSLKSNLAYNEVTDVTVRLLWNPWCDLPLDALFSFQKVRVILTSLQSEKNKIILWLGKANDMQNI